MTDCKECGTSLVRVPRKPWMRIIPSSKRYKCDHCSNQFLEIFNRLVKLEKPASKRTGLS